MRALQLQIRKPSITLLLQPTKLSFHRQYSSQPRHAIKPNSAEGSHAHTGLTVDPPSGKISRRENIYTIPNLITSSRIILCPVLSYTIIHNQHLISAGVLLYCAVSDWVDGKLARMYPDQMASVLGTILDPAADKILMTTLYLLLQSSLEETCCFHYLHFISDIILYHFQLRHIFIVQLSSSGVQFNSNTDFQKKNAFRTILKTFARFWDFSLPSAQVTPTQISKYNTFLQLILVGLTTINPIIPMDIQTPMTILQLSYISKKTQRWTVATSTITSGLSYIFSRNAIRYI
ncbi:hypothetical protein PSHT_05178 [Puccinia striiformis]|uniref:CDP-diacylglycerol-glycerol-3-phosphate 3-phosphatidyltransferase n=1 Tax=Puccinia striiformis TaxID=27350 RepID=A0A2S4WB46_9BASI|nr:hypothetical protein PSHT_05178 [Puccinia striiformis]